MKDPEGQERGELHARMLDGYISLYVRHPCKCCCSCAFAMFLLACTAILTNCMAIVQNESGWLIIGGQATQNMLALRLARDVAEERSAAARSRLISGGDPGGRRLDADGTLVEAVAHPARFLGEAKKAPTPRTPRLSEAPGGLDAAAPGGLRRLQADAEEEAPTKLVSFTVYYKTNKDATGTIFTPTVLQHICRLEEAWVANVTANSNASYFEWRVRDSVVNIFYSRFANGSRGCPDLNATVVQQGIDTIKSDVDSVGSFSRYSRFLDKHFATSGESAYTRGYFSYNALKSDAQLSVEDFFEQIGRRYEMFTGGYLMGSPFLGEEDRFVQHGYVRIRVATNGINEMEVMVAPDFLYTVLATFLVWCIIAYFLKSGVAALLAMFQILMSLPVASLIYKGLTIDHFEFLHILVMYLVLGIGADDVFVLYDTFRHISDEVAPMTTPGSYDDQTLFKVLRLTWIRSAQAIFNTSFTTTMAFMSCSGSKAMPMRTCSWYAAFCIITNYVFTMTFTPACLVIWHKYVQGKCCMCRPCRERPAAVPAPPGEARKESQPNGIEWALHKYYIPAMNWKKFGVRPVPIAITLTMLAVSAQGIYNTSLLSPPREEEVWFPSNHMLMELTEFMSGTFYQPAHDGFEVLQVVYGIIGFDASEVPTYKPEQGGKVIFDSAFDLSTTEAQQSVLGMCEQLKTLKCELPGCRNSDGFDTLMLAADGKPYSCLLEDFRTWNNGSLPVGAEFATKLREFRDTVDARNLTDPLLDGQVNYRRDIGFVEDRLMYFVAMKIRSSMPKKQGFTKGFNVREMLNTWAAEQRAASPAPLKSLMVLDDAFGLAKFDLPSELLQGLFQGCAIAGPIAFVVLLASTKNIIVSTYAVCAVGSVVVCVLGFCRSAMDWDLGVGEAIAGIIVIGYSVDFVVHLAHIFCEAAHHGCNTRAEKAEFAIRNMGSTVFAGAITTAGSACVMYFCFFYFFIKMATLIVVTIMFSFLFSLGFFMSVVWLVGPEHGFGDLDKMLRGRSGRVVRFGGAALS